MNKIKKISDFILSFFELTFKVVLAPKAKVLFYYPQHFNRSAEGTNPFFDPLLETCQRHGISYKLIEEPDWGTDKPRNGKAIKGDWLFVLIWILRKIIGKVHSRNSFAKNERIVAGYLNFLTFGKLRFPKYISISGSMEPLFLCLTKDSEVFEVQHGIDYSNKSSYFRGGCLYEAYQDNRWHLLSYGEGYRDCVIRGHEEELSSRVHVIGCPLTLTPSEMPVIPDSEKDIVFSLQLTHDWKPNALTVLKKLLADTLEQLSGSGRTVLLKHHPRYNNCVPMDDIYGRFSFVKETHESLAELQKHTFLHVTLNSTTAFEFAAAGIPSFFMRNGNNLIPCQSLFYYEYQYPLFENMSIEETLEYLSDTKNYEEVSSIIKKWYSHFYAEYDETAILKLIENK